MKKYQVVSLGCRTNQYESQAFADQLRQMGYAKAQEGEEADLCIVNTCTVTDHADASSRHQIRQLAKRHAGARLVVTGCMAESAPEEIRALDQRIEIVGNLDKERLVASLFPEEDDLPEFRIEAFEGHTRAFLKVQDGCNSFCTYCIIPYVRGRSRSKPLAEVLDEAAALVKNGYREIVLTGINIGDYQDRELRLADLVRKMDQVEGLNRIRISSIDPDEVDENLASAVLLGRSTCPNLHLVLQSGSNVVLKRMNRKYTKQVFLDTVERLVRQEPDFTFTTDVIVGFPGERDADFAETLDLVRRVRFAKVHMFPYSPRSRTRAALYPDRVPHDVLSRRKQELLRAAETAAFELRAGFVGRTMEVLLEEGEGDVLYGHTNNFLRVRVEKGAYQSNQLVSVELVDNAPDALIGKIR